MSTRTSDIIAICFTAEKNVSLDLGPEDERNKKNHRAAKLHRQKQGLVELKEMIYVEI